MRFTALTLLLCTISGSFASAEVSRFELNRRERVGTSSYEKIVGTVYFTLDPAHERNRVIADIELAARKAIGRAECAADLYILRPIDAAQSNGTALVDIPNRGAKLILQNISGAPGRNDFIAETDFGDGLLTSAGFTIVWVGWQFDLPPRPAFVGFQAPTAQGISGVVRASFTPNMATPAFTVADLAGYAPSDPEGADSVLTVRDGPFGQSETIPRSRWQLEGQIVSLNGGFEAGRTYEVAYRSANPAVAGAGLAAVRDVVSWLKHAPDAPTRISYAVGYGASQSARMLRAFLYNGFNTDEQGRQVLDGVMAFGAGATRLSLNERWAVPNGNGFFTSASFPFADTAQRDPATGRIDGLLDNERARVNQPRVFWVNTASEYWGMGRSAALIHTSPDGSRDLTIQDNVRVYFASSTQHLGAQFPPRVTQGQHADNTLGAGPLRALLMALIRWVREGVPPPPSRYPHLADGTLVRSDDVRFPVIRDVAQPKGIPAGRDGGRLLPVLVPQVDADGNDIAGIRVASLAAPLATYTGWNFRNPNIGGTGELVPFLGSSIPFAATKAGREAAADARSSLEERFESLGVYLQRVRDAQEQLVREGFALPDELTNVLRRAEERWKLYAAVR
jgi:hypothetical protein